MIKQIFIAVLVGMAIGYLICKHYTPSEIETVTKDRVVTRVKVVKSPDGTVTTEVIKDKTKEQSQKVENVVGPSWRVSLGAAVPVQPLQLVPVYKLEVSKKILGPLDVGLWGTSNGLVGVSLGAQF